jgi:hypothetical protein
VGFRNGTGRSRFERGATGSIRAQERAAARDWLELGRVQRRYVDVDSVERDLAVCRLEYVAERQGDLAAVVTRVSDFAFADDRVSVRNDALQLMASAANEEKNPSTAVLMAACPFTGGVEPKRNSPSGAIKPRKPSVSIASMDTKSFPKSTPPWELPVTADWRSS